MTSTKPPAASAPAAASGSVERQIPSPSQADGSSSELAEMVERVHLLTERRQALQGRGDQAGVAKLDQALRRLAERISAHPASR